MPVLEEGCRDKITSKLGNFFVSFEALIGLISGIVPFIVVLLVIPLMHFECVKVKENKVYKELCGDFK